MRISRIVLTAFGLVLASGCESGREPYVDSLKAEAAALTKRADSLNQVADGIRQKDATAHDELQILFDSAKALQKEANRVGEAGNPRAAMRLLDSAQAVNRRGDEVKGGRPPESATYTDCLKAARLQGRAADELTGRPSETQVEARDANFKSICKTMPEIYLPDLR